ncbi:MAG: hypothetical protein QG635_867 [Bacteroidota bacterium]|nr:hypothetical protein [Bacteroidota bacterium]
MEPEPGKAAISGFITDSANGESIIGATVTLKGTNYGAYTNESGFFSLINIPPGSYTIHISSVSYSKKDEKIVLNPDESKRVKFKLRLSSITTREITVEADKEEDKREITVSKITVPTKQLKQIRIGGESDVFRSLQMLPGILTSSQLSSGLFVRGGSPDQNLVLLDGSTVYNPSHLFGFISTFNSDAIKDVELIKGGFPAEYGGRLSAVLNLTQKDGNRNQFDGLASLGALSSKLSLEGPIGNGSWFIGGRRTYLELIKAVYPGNFDVPLPDFNFYDLNAKITQNFGDDDKVSLSGFMSSDALLYDSFGMNLDMALSNKLVAAKWNHIFSERLFVSVNTSASQYSNIMKGDQSGYQFLIDNSITDYTGRVSFEWLASEEMTNKFGIEGINYRFAYLQNFTGNTDSTASGMSGAGTNLELLDWNFAVYAQTNYRFAELYSMQAGLRVNYWMLSNYVTLDPRVAIKWQFQPKASIKAAFGVYHQSLRLASQPDFSFFDTWLPTDSTIPASRAYHYILSLEAEPFEDFDFNFDLYYKQMFNLNEINQNALNGKSISDVFYIGNAESYGAEIFIQKKYGNLTGWVGYALGFIYAKFDSINFGKEYRPKYDRRHDFKIVAQYQFNDTWTVGASFIFQSGQSYTGATSRFQSRWDRMNYGRGKVIPSEKFGLRLPPSHQLNLYVSYGFEGFGLPMKLILDIYNVYNRRDVWFRYYNTRENTTTVEDALLLPIIPTLSYEVNF